MKKELISHSIGSAVRMDRETHFIVARRLADAGQNSPEIGVLALLKYR